jgi:hypothetical protein
MKFKKHPVWHQAMIRGLEEGLRVDRLRFPPEYANDGFDVFLVESSRKDGSKYQVEYHGSEHDSWVVCSCRGGQNRRACKHAALVLYYRGELVPRALERVVTVNDAKSRPIAA